MELAGFKYSMDGVWRMWIWILLASSIPWMAFGGCGSGSYLLQVFHGWRLEDVDLDLTCFKYSMDGVWRRWIWSLLASSIPWMAFGGCGSGSYLLQVFHGWRLEDVDLDLTCFKYSMDGVWRRWIWSLLASSIPWMVFGGGGFGACLLQVFHGWRLEAVDLELTCFKYSMDDVWRRWIWSLLASSIPWMTFGGGGFGACLLQVFHGWRLEAVDLELTCFKYSMDDVWRLWIWILLASSIPWMAFGGCGTGSYLLQVFHGWRLEAVDLDLTCFKYSMEGVWRLWIWILLASSIPWMALGGGGFGSYLLQVFHGWRLEAVDLELACFKYSMDGVWRLWIWILLASSIPWMAFGGCGSGSYLLQVFHGWRLEAVDLDLTCFKYSMDGV